MSRSRQRLWPKHNPKPNHIPRGAAHPSGAPVVTNRAKVPVNRKAYLRWCLLGVFGAQRFYAKQWKMGLLYLVTCWSGFSIAMTMIDAMIAVPMKSDENGIIYL